MHFLNFNFQTEEHHTDNESDESHVPSLPGFAHHTPKINFHQIAQREKLKSGESSTSSRMSLEVATEHLLEDAELTRKEVEGLMEMEEAGSDALSGVAPEDLDNDESHYLSLQFLNHYSSGDLQWCQDYPEHGMPCRKCGLKGHTVIQCTNPVQERCIFCGQYNHRHYTCPDAQELEYKQYLPIPCCYCGQAVSLK